MAENDKFLQDPEGIHVFTDRAKAKAREEELRRKLAEILASSEEEEEEGDEEDA